MFLWLSFGRHICTQCCAYPWGCNCQARVCFTDTFSTCRFCPIASKLVRPISILAGSVEGIVINTDMTDKQSSQSWGPFCMCSGLEPKIIACWLLPLLWETSHPEWDATLSLHFLPALERSECPSLSSFPCWLWPGPH